MKNKEVHPTKSDTAVEAFTELTLAVFRLNGTLIEWGDRLVEPLGLTSARWQMLGAIALAGAPLTAPQLGAAMGVTRQGAQKQLNLLMEQGLVETQPNSARQRSPLYVLTSRGSSLYWKADALWAAQASKLATQIKEAHACAAAQVLESMLQQLLAANPSSKIES